MSEQKQTVPPPFQLKKECPDYKSEQLIRNIAEIVCMNYGFGIDERLASKGPERMAFNIKQ